jgi:tight adherence protein B
MVPVALGLLYVVFVIPRLILTGLIRQRQLLLREQMVKASVALANSARAGLSQAQGLELVGRESPPPLATEFLRMTHDYHAGQPLANCLEEADKRLDLEAFSVFSAVLLVCMERGGNVAFALDRISTSLQEMQRLNRKIETETASGQRLALVLALFPLIFLLGFTLLDPAMMQYMYTTLLGQFLLLVAGVLVYLSYRWCQRIVNIDF